MSSVSTVTISGNDYSVYGTEAEVKQYLAGRLGTEAYDNASGGERKKAHVQATRWLDRERWTGSPTDTTTPQPLAWPRTGVTDCDGNAVPDNVVPDDLCAATAELVLVLLQDSSADQNATQGTNIRRAQAGSAIVEFFRPGSSDGSGQNGTIFPTQVQKLVGCFLEGASGYVAPDARGTDQPSSFCEDDYNLKRGYS